MFSKSYCPHCTKAKTLLSTLNVPCNVLELDLIENGAQIQDELAQLSGQRTVPNIFIKGNHVGGCDKIHELHSQGKLLAMLQ